MRKSKLFTTAITFTLLTAILLGCAGPSTTPEPTTVPTPTHPPPSTPEPVIVIPTTNVKVTKDVEYGRAGDIALLLDIYTPETPITSPMPVVIWIHGGGFRSGDKNPSRIRTLASHGFLGLSINYRLSGVAKFPAAIEDAKCAVRWIRANAEKYNVDPERIGVWGGSAGGHLAMLVGTADATAGLEGNGGWEGVSSRVRAISSFWGSSDFVSLIDESSANSVTRSGAFAFLGGTIEEKPDIYKLASPVTYVTTDDPPLFMVHGTLDQVIPLEQSEIMYRSYSKAGLDVTLITVTGADHGLKQVTDNLISPSEEEINEMVLDFFVKHLLLK